MESLIKNSEDKKDVLEAIKEIKRLQALKEMPERNSIIDALQNAKNKAPVEITALEFSQGDRYLMPFVNFTDADLYRKLSQYQQGLEGYCIKKIGKKAFDELMKKCGCLMSYAYSETMCQLSAHKLPNREL